MGIDTSAKLIYGLNYSDLPEEILEEVNDMLDYGDLDHASPYYGASRDEWIIGLLGLNWLVMDMNQRILKV